LTPRRGEGKTHIPRCFVAIGLLVRPGSACTGHWRSFFEQCRSYGPRGIKHMKPQSKVSFFRHATSVLTIAALGISSAALWGAPAAPPAALTPEQISKLLEDGTTVLKGGNPELAIKNYFEPVNQSFMRQTAKAGADDEIYATHSATETSAYSA